MKDNYNFSKIQVKCWVLFCLLICSIIVPYSLIFGIGDFITATDITEIIPLLQEIRTYLVVLTLTLIVGCGICINVCMGLSKLEGEDTNE